MLLSKRLRFPIGIYKTSNTLVHFRLFCYLVKAIKQTHQSACDPKTDIGSDMSQELSSVCSQSSKYKLSSDAKDAQLSNDDIHESLLESLQECLLDGLGVWLNLTNESGYLLTFLHHLESNLVSRVGAAANTLWRIGTVTALFRNRVYQVGKPERYVALSD